MELYNKFQKQLDDIASLKKTIQMQIPCQSISRVIGKDGNVIKRVKNISGADINIDTSTAIVNITAKKSDSLTIAKELISKVIANPTPKLQKFRKNKKKKATKGRSR